MNHSLSLLALASLSLFSAACTGEVVAAPLAEQTGGDGGSGGGTTAVVAGGGGDGGAAACVPEPVDPDAPFEQPTCADLSGLTLGAAVITDAGGDGKVSPGESATITVPLVEIAGKGFGWYPGVTFTSESATIDNPGSAQFYAILACQTLDASVGVTIPPSVAKGTVVKVKAQVSMLNEPCPDAPAITVSIPIE